MLAIERLPALPLIANDPYFSIWMPADTVTDADSAHWSGPKKQLRGTIAIDGEVLRFLGSGTQPAMQLVGQQVTPTKTIITFKEKGILLRVTFWSPALPEDLDTLSTPITFIDFKLTSADQKKHQVEINFSASTRLCYDGDTKPELWVQCYKQEGLSFAFAGQRRQNILNHSADHITIDWGYLYLAAAQGSITGDQQALCYNWKKEIVPEGQENHHIQIAYDDIASILYFGTPCKAWYTRGGKTLPQAMVDFEHHYEGLMQACSRLDEMILDEADHIGGKNYQILVSAAWRHTLAAHKLIATPKGDCAWISKENDSNGCMCTVDISYPSSPLFLKYQPQLVNAMCRPVLEFASMPVWNGDFAPHDIGRYPIANGQMYAARIPDEKIKEADVTPPFYLYPKNNTIYDIRYQMPVEECGNMLIMLTAAAQMTGDPSLVKAYRPVLAKWVQYLEKYGEDPGEQLCTDDFAGHLAHNVNLSAKALVGIACYGKLIELLGEDGSPYFEKAKAMAKSWYERSYQKDGYTSLTFEGIGWSQKYNLVWDIVLGLGLFPADFYKEETQSYLNRQNTYGLPLDSRKTYTKSDWILWSATMAQDKETFNKLIEPLVAYLRETPSRVAFSDWYDTVTGKYEHFIARSVQGGLFMPMLRKDWQI